MKDDVVLVKINVIERCLKRIQAEYNNDSQNLRANVTKQDSIILNLERACQATIDLAMHICRSKKLGLPQESRDAFQSLRDANLIDEKLKQKMFGLVGFRNTAVHNYRSLDLDVVENIIRSRLNDFIDFINKCRSIEL